MLKTTLVVPNTAEVPEKVCWFTDTSITHEVSKSGRAASQTSLDLSGVLPTRLSIGLQDFSTALQPGSSLCISLLGDDARPSWTVIAANNPIKVVGSRNNPMTVYYP